MQFFAYNFLQRSLERFLLYVITNENPANLDSQIEWPTTLRSNKYFKRKNTGELDS